MSDNGNVRRINDHKALQAAAALGILGPVVHTDGEPEFEEVAFDPADDLPEPAVPAAPSTQQAQWERCAPWIAAGLDGSHHTMGDLEDRTRRGDAMLWPGDRCAVLTQIVAQTDGARILDVISAGGDLDEIVAMTPGVLAAARAAGCSEMIVEGKRGWERALKPLGFTFLSVTVRKVL